MEQYINNNLNGGSINEYTGGNTVKNYYNVLLFQDSEREFVVTHNTDTKSVSYFTGREMELQDLRQRMEEKRKSVLVSGMGGIGKTHICRKLFEEYFEQHAKDGGGPFEYIGYIEYNGDMDSSLQRCLKFKKQDNPKGNLEAAWRELEYLASGGKLLLFVDNVDRSMREDPGLQRLNSIPGAVILTSRLTNFSDAFEPYRIGFLSDEQCKRIYETIRFENSGRKVGIEEIYDLGYIINKLAGRHTITIEFLAHLAWTRKWSVKQLKEKLDEKGFQLEFKQDGKITNIQKSYESLYDLSKLTKAEQNILEAFSVFPYTSVSVEICNNWLLMDAGVSEDDDVLIELYRKGWLQFDLTHESYSIHPVFAQFIYDRNKPKVENHLGLIQACQECLKIPDSGAVIECRKFIPFAENIVEKTVLGKGKEQAKFINVFAYLLLNMAEYEKAATLYEKSLEIYKDLLDEEDPIIATNYNDLAGVYVRQGAYEKAEKLYIKGLKIQEKKLGEDNLDTTCSYSNLAYVYRRQGKYEQAKELSEKSLRIRERLFGKYNIETAKGYDSLAEILRKQKEYEQAERLYKTSLEIRKRIQKEDHPDIGVAYSGLASLYAETGNYEMAEELFGRSLDIQKAALGEMHPKIAVIYCNMAFTYERMGNHEKALDYNFKGYKILAIKVGPSHPNYEVAYRNLKRRYFDCNLKGDFNQWLERKMEEVDG